MVCVIVVGVLGCRVVEMNGLCEGCWVVRLLR